MRGILILTRKDLLRRLANPTALLLSLAVPLVIATTIGLTFGRRGSGAEQNVPRLRMVVVNLDKGPISEILAGATQNAEASKHMEIRQAPTRAEGLRLLRDDEYAALVVIPEGFGDALLNRRKTRLELVKNPSQLLMPVAAQQIVEVAALYVSGAAKLLGEDAARVQKVFEEGRWKDGLEVASLAASLRDRFESIDALLLPPIIEVAEPKPEGAPARDFDLMGWMFPGMTVMALLFTGMTQMKDLLRERDMGTLRRQLAAPLGPGAVLIAKVLSVGAVVAAADVILMIVGAAGLGVRWGATLPLLASSFVLVAAVTGFSAMVFAVVRTERQGDAFGGILTMLMSLLGGAFVPVQAMPDWMATLARFTLSYWGNETLRTLSTGGGWLEVIPFLQVLAVLGLAMTVLGVALLRRRHLAGAL